MNSSMKNKFRYQIKFVLLIWIQTYYHDATTNDPSDSMLHKGGVLCLGRRHTVYQIQQGLASSCHLHVLGRAYSFKN